MGEAEYVLHPLALLTITDHTTRERVRNRVERPKVYGGLFGNTLANKTQFHAAFELPLTLSTPPSIDCSYLLQKLEQLKEVFAEFEFQGLYSTGSCVTPEDIESLKKVSSCCSITPAFLLVDLNNISQSTKLPIQLYRTEITIIDQNNDLQINLIESKVQIETQAGEEIAINNLSSDAQGSNPTVEYLQNTRKAMVMLNNRIETVLQYLERVQNGSVPFDHSIMRKINGVVNSLSAENTPNFESDFSSNYNDILLTQYLGTLTSCASLANDVFNNISSNRK